MLRRGGDDGGGLSGLGLTGVGRSDAVALQQALEQAKVVEIVAGDVFERGLEGDGAALGVVRGAVAVGRADGGEQQDVPGAEGVKRALSGGEVVLAVVDGPAVLVEGREGGGVGVKDLAEPPGESDLAIGHMRHDLAEAPLVRAGCSVDLVGGERVEQVVEARGSGGDDVLGRLVAEVVGVGVLLFHGYDVSSFGRAVFREMKSGVSGPWVVLAEGPEVVFGVEAGKGLAAVVHGR